MAVDKNKNEDLSNLSAKELKEMADKLLAEAEAEASAPAEEDKGLSVDDYIEKFTLIEMAPEGNKKRSAKKAKPKTSKPAMDISGKTPEEVLAMLLEKGKKSGTLSNKELEVLEGLNIDSEQMDKFYASLEAAGIFIHHILFCISSVRRRADPRLR